MVTTEAKDGKENRVIKLFKIYDLKSSTMASKALETKMKKSPGTTRI